MTKREDLLRGSRRCHIRNRRHRLCIIRIDRSNVVGILDVCTVVFPYPCVAFVTQRRATPDRDRNAGASGHHNHDPSSSRARPATAAGPALGDPCIGAEIGRRTVDANGTAIICDNYVWVVDSGQQARHPWADDQTEWAECIQMRTEEECRALLNGETATSPPG